MTLSRHWFSSFLLLAAGTGLAVGTRPAAAQDPLPQAPPPALKQILDNTGNLSLTPQPLPLPPELKFEPRQNQRPSFLVARVTQWSTPSAPESTFLNNIGQVFDAQDTYWPQGTQTSVHIQPKTDDGVGRWVPFVSLAQDTDEVDAHVRNGIGAGVTYRFNKHARVDVEGMFVQHNGDQNPLLRDETRGLVVFSVDF